MVLLLALLLQASSGQSTQDARTLEHVRRNLERDAATLSAPPPLVPIFRIRISERPPVLDQLWQGEQAAPPYVHTPQPIYHHDFLYAVTPEAFRAATLYPIGVPMMPAVERIGRAVAGSIHSYKEQRARQQVRRDLDRLRAEATGERTLR
jgi:hypothetical protein